MLGSLIEKEITTPDNYPLTLNALVTACNQTSNRDPVLTLDEATVAKSLEDLARQSLVREVHRSDSRAKRYRHLLSETLHLHAGEIAAMCVLMLRGPQTVGEIRTRTARLFDFVDLTHVECDAPGVDDAEHAAGRANAAAARSEGSAIRTPALGRASGQCLRTDSNRRVAGSHADGGARTIDRMRCAVSWLRCAHNSMNSGANSIDRVLKRCAGECGTNFYRADRAATASWACHNPRPRELKVSTSSTHTARRRMAWWRWCDCLLCRSCASSQTYSIANQQFLHAPRPH